MAAPSSHTSNHRPSLLRCLSWGLWVVGWAATPAPALTLTVDYTYDAAAEDLFGRFPAAKAAMNQAAADISALIATRPTEISNDYFIGTSGPAEVSFDLNLRFRDPSLNIMREVDIPFIAEGEVIIYVGSQSLSENTLALGEISSVKNTIFSNVAGTPTQLQAATGIAAADAEAEWRRGGDGPVFNTLSGPVNLGGTTVNFTADMGPIAASVWFDSDTNNNGDSDTNAQLAAYWHFDHTTPPPPDKFDFYSSALHEILHGLGLGTAQSYTQLYATSEGEPIWLGPTGQYLNGGSAFNLAHIDSRHLVDGLMSPRLSDGVLQEVLLARDIERGVRKGVTLMDAAFLQDTSWTLTSPIPIPEPTSLAWLGLLFALRRRR
ncbi:MAG: hypothetical protein ACKV19_02700 [Verrucomicrobiales bacterium]